MEQGDLSEGPEVGHQRMGQLGTVEGRRIEQALIWAVKPPVEDEQLLELVSVGDGLIEYLREEGVEEGEEEMSK